MNCFLDIKFFKDILPVILERKGHTAKNKASQCNNRDVLNLLTSALSTNHQPFHVVAERQIHQFRTIFKFQIRINVKKYLLAT